MSKTSNRTLTEINKHWDEVRHLPVMHIERIIQIESHMSPIDSVTTYKLYGLSNLGNLYWYDFEVKDWKEI